MTQQEVLKKPVKVFLKLRGSWQVLWRFVSLPECSPAVSFCLLLSAVAVPFEYIFILL
jgi:ABC-type sulfate transport system permease subunit